MWGVLNRRAQDRALRGFVRMYTSGNLASLNVGDTFSGLYN